MRFHFVFLLLLASSAQAQTIDALGSAGALSGSENVPIFQTANPAVKTTTQAIANLAPNIPAAGSYKINGNNAAYYTSTNELSWFLANAGNPSAGGNGNLGIGLNALLSMTGQVGMTCVGPNSCSFDTNTNDEYVTALGDHALELGTTFGGGFVVGIGAFAGNNDTGGNNTFVGALAGFANTSGTNIVDVGAYAGRLATGSGITAIGNQALYNATGDQNTGLGNGAGLDLTSGANNTFIGSTPSGNGITTGSNNTIFGPATGLSSSLAGNIILADGLGNVKARWDGSNWTFTGGVSCAAGTVNLTTFAVTNGLVTHC